MFKDKKRSIIILTALVAAALLVFVFGSFGSKESKNVALSASSEKESYSLGEEIILNLSLKNLEQEQVCISNMATGNINISSITRDGENVETRNGLSYFITSLEDILKSNIEPVSAGESLNINFTSELDNNFNTQALIETTPENGRGVNKVYNMGAPGNYEVELFYEYTGESAEDCSNTFKGQTNIIKANFEITTN